MVKLVLFDIDGTLVHTGGAGIKAFARAFHCEFNAPHGVERIKFAGRTDVSLVREFMGLHNIAPTPENFRRFFDSYVFWLDHVLRESQTHACRGVLGFIERLRDMATPPRLGLLTGNIRLGAEIKLRHFNLWETFEIGGFADDHEERDKIAVVAHQRGSHLCGGKLQSSEVLVIGDTPFDIRCGKAIGAKVLAVATGGATYDELKQHNADWVVEDLRETSAEQICGY